MYGLKNTITIILQVYETENTEYEKSVKITAHILSKTIVSKIDTLMQKSQCWSIFAVYEFTKSTLSNNSG